jgi:hypothetical protein
MKVTIEMEKLTEDQKNIIKKNIKTCWICSNQFQNDESIVFDHDHYTGKFRGLAHSSCNILLKRPRHITVTFHNFSNYDCHLIIEKLANTPGKLRKIKNIVYLCTIRIYFILFN